MRTGFDATYQWYIHLFDTSKYMSMESLLHHPSTMQVTEDKIHKWALEGIILMMRHKGTRETVYNVKDVEKAIALDHRMVVLPCRSY